MSSLSIILGSKFLPRWIASLAILASCGVSAAPILLIDAGKLTGAENVLVQGTAYNVLFQGGTCNSLFNGCTSFAFHTQAAANAASQALLDQVFVDGPAGNFDSAPQMTRGCGNLFTCEILTPFDTAIFNSQLYALTGTLLNDMANINDRGALSGGFAANEDTSSYGALRYAVWNLAQVDTVDPDGAVPEPSSFAMLAIGVIALSIARRKRIK